MKNKPIKEGDIMNLDIFIVSCTYLVILGNFIILNIFSTQISDTGKYALFLVQAITFTLITLVSFIAILNSQNKKNLKEAKKPKKNENTQHKSVTIICDAKDRAKIQNSKNSDPLNFEDWFGENNTKRRF